MFDFVLELGWANGDTTYQPIIARDHDHACMQALKYIQNKGLSKDSRFKDWFVSEKEDTE